MSERLQQLICYALVAVVSTVLFIMDRDRPDRPYWDENYYVTSAQRYLESTAQFASHPPLGLMLIAAGEKFTGTNAGLDSTSLTARLQVRGEDLPLGFSFSGLRLMPAIFAAASAMLFLGLMMALTQRPFIALALSALYLYENAFMAHLSAAHLDAFQIFFLLTAIWCVLSSVRRNRLQDPWLDFAFGLSLGLAVMVKANAVVFAVMGLWLVGRRWRRARIEGRQRCLGRASTSLALMLSGVMIASAGVLALHAANSWKFPDLNSDAGKRHAAYFSAAHTDYLRQSSGLNPRVLFHIGNDYLRFMASDLAGVPKGKKEDSAVLLWPLHDKPLSYRWDSNGAETRYVQLAGNLVNWSAGLLALLTGAASVVIRRFSQRHGLRCEQDAALLEVLLLTYVVYMAVHAWLGTQRIMYLYHYFPALLLTYLMVPLAFAAPVKARGHCLVLGHVAALGFAASSVAMSAFIWPINRHEALSHEDCHKRNLTIELVKCR